MSQSPHIVNRPSHPMHSLQPGILRGVVQEPDPAWDGQYGLDESPPTELGPSPALSQGTQPGRRLPPLLRVLDLPEAVPELIGVDITERSHAAADRTARMPVDVSFPLRIACAAALLLALLCGGCFATLPQPKDPPQVQMTAPGVYDVTLAYAGAHGHQAQLLLQQEAGALAERYGCTGWHARLTELGEQPNKDKKPVEPPPEGEAPPPPPKMVTLIKGELVCSSEAGGTTGGTP